MDSTAPKVARFGLFELDLVSRELRKQGLKVRLADQPVQILLLLLERAGEPVTREELRQKLWPADTFVDFDAGMNSAIKKLRDAFGDSAETPRFIETLPRRGYRFIAPIEQPPAHRDEHRPIQAEVPRRRLRRRWVTGAIVAVIAVAAWLVVVALSVRNEHGANATHIDSIAVLPFKNLSPDNEQEYFVDGITEMLTTNLAQFKTFKVASSTSAMQYKQNAKPLAQIARELDADVLVQATVMRSGNRVHVMVNLIEAATNGHLSAKTYDRAAGDALELQISLADEIAVAIHDEVRAEEQRHLRSQAVKPGAYDAYRRGRYYLNNRSPDQLLSAKEFFDTAIQLDPKFALPHSGLSDLYRVLEAQGFDAPRVLLPRAERAARDALDLDPDLAEAHASLAGVLYRQWKWREAEQEFDRALELDPNYAEGHRARGMFLVVLRRNDEAVKAFQRARDLDPYSHVITVELAGALNRADRHDEALQQVNRAREIAPDFWRVPQTEAQVYLRKGDLSRALDILQGSSVPRPSQGQLSLFGYLCALSGREQEARKALADLKSRQHTEHVFLQNLALIHLGLRETEQALELLEKASREGAFELPLFSGPIADRLLGNPRFQKLLQKMDLAAQPGYKLPAAGKPPR